MMTQAFYTGISGLKNYSAGIDVVSNNIANISTTGYRAYNAEYASLFEEALAGATSTVSPQSVGYGVRMQATAMSTEQGTLALSDRSTDLAILGEGWFGVRGDSNTIYTRDGGFNIDANADLVTNDGLHVLGTMGNNISADNVLTSILAEVALGDVNSVEKLRFPKNLTYPPEPTTTAKFIANVGVGYEPVTVGASVVDSQNNRNHLRLEFTKKAVQTPPGSQYDVRATVESLDGTTVYSTASGEVTFDGKGALASNTLTSINNNGSTIAINLGSGYDGMVSMDVPLVSGSSLADGTIGGDLQGYSISQNGEVLATFTNGKQSSVGKIAVFHFQNEQGLNRVSGTRFEESANSGKAFFYKDADGNNIIGTNIQNFRLESANYDMASGLTELIVLQRAYDANSKSITTADQMIQKALNMGA
ncbi:flagellar hook-basal body complex protein [Sulfurimonas sp. C5]|uniref:flagellar hook protein FlgE n=1 Tax=Sulfurimonas sp. C5 TaxID=3036947 RepID=UPI002458FE2E|nr:flagellar hook-basal body complex protein [Sulfurimonas sp. C5]MDH4944852.1 flagellar hook-basal body complex protein [Sulfurimonas sp. C5]